MNKTQVIIISLLIVAIAFSAVSIALNLSLDDIKPIKSQASTQDVPVGNPNGNVNLVVSPTPVNNG